MEPDLEPAIVKIHRAGHQLNHLSSSLKQFLDSKPFEIEREVDPKTLWVFDVARIKKQCPPEWNIIVGEIIHNLRSALDYLIFQLVIHETAAEPSGNSKIQFPIFEKEDGFDTRGVRIMLRDVGADAVALIKSEQPFATGDGRKSPLWFLRELSNRDKHRSICLAGTCGQGMSAEGVYPEVTGVAISSPKPIKDNAKLYGVKLTPSDEPILERASKVQMTGKFRFYIAFEQPAIAAGMPMDRLLHMIAHRVHTIANRIRTEIIKR
jgi:hypothetical protein